MLLTLPSQHHHSTSQGFRDNDQMCCQYVEAAKHTIAIATLRTLLLASPTTKDASTSTETNRDAPKHRLLTQNGKATITQPPPLLQQHELGRGVFDGVCRTLSHASLNFNMACHVILKQQRNKVFMRPSEPTSPPAGSIGEQLIAFLPAHALPPPAASRELKPHRRGPSAAWAPDQLPANFRKKLRPPHRLLGCQAAVAARACAPPRAGCGLGLGSLHSASRASPARRAGRQRRLLCLAHHRHPPSKHGAAEPLAAGAAAPQRRARGGCGTQPPAVLLARQCRQEHIVWSCCSVALCKVPRCFRNARSICFVSITNSPESSRSPNQLPESSWGHVQLPANTMHAH